VVAGRYRIESELGRGGMAVAYAVHDLVHDRPLALKRLLANESAAASTELEQLFEREFHTLQQLGHPRIVAVHDFAYDGGCAFYTMEWLGGGDLSKLAPLPAQRVCALLSDVCSALSLLHSRGLVHRDVTPRNVRCTDDGLAKLIDFGAIASFGSTPRLLGTPPCCPPEAVDGEELDGRTDLFALGATAYFALTGRHAYGAHTFTELRNAWSRAPRPPSHYAAGVPPALDALVLSLLSLDRAARPGSAAEVMERLCVIGEIDVLEQLVVQQAYLETPRLVGRDGELARVRKMLAKAHGDRPRAAVIVGLEGSGRSRFLASCVVEAKLQGALVARADATNARGPLSVAKALADELLQLLPALGDELGTEQRDALSQAWLGADPEAQARLQTAVRDLMLRVASTRKLVLAVDDAHHIDERSAALLALLITERSEHDLVVLATLPSADANEVNASLRFFVEAASVLKMRPLASHETESLLQSIFGDVAHLRALADPLHRLSSGAPGALLQLAQHMIDRGLVRYEAGAWLLPAEHDPADMPSSLHAALQAKFAKLSPQSRALAEGLALVRRDGLDLDELKVLLASDDTRAVLSAVDELVALGIARLTGSVYRLTTETYRALLTPDASSEQTRVLHGRLAGLIEHRAGNRSWAVIEHLISAGREQEALDRILPGARDQSKLTPRQIADRACDMPSDWPKHLRALIAYCERVGRPAIEAHLVRVMLVGYGSLTAQAERADVEVLIRQLEHDCGYDIFVSLDASMPHSERLMKARALAQQRFDATPASQRVLPVAEALPSLARAVIGAIGVMGPRNDYAFFRELRSIEPFVALAPALQLVQWNVEGTRALATGHYRILHERNAAILTRIAEPDRAGLDEITCRFMGLALKFSTTLVDTLFGRTPDEGYLADLEDDPIFTINACRLRMLAALCQGDVKAADTWKRKAEMIRLRENPPQMFEGSHLLREFVTYAVAGDLARLKQLLPAIEHRAQRTPGWHPTLHHARGAYHELRGALPEALAELEAGLRLTRAGEHPSHAQLAASYLLVLLKLERAPEALSIGQELLAGVRAAELGPASHVLLEAMASVYAKNALHDEARRLADEAIALLEGFRAGGLVLGGAFETRARVALAADDRPAFEVFARKCAAIYRGGRSALLRGRYAALVASATAAQLSMSDEVDSSAADLLAKTLQALSQNHSNTRGGRALVALRAVVAATGAGGGFLYTVQRDGSTLMAQEGAVVAPLDLDNLVAQVLARLTSEQDDVTIAHTVAPGEVSAAVWRNALGDVFTPIVLTHASSRGVEITGVLALRGLPESSQVSRQLLSGISEALHQSGDAATLLAG
jgi:serine/threonine-protein kinase